jgi:hypothetical protein
MKVFIMQRSVGYKVPDGESSAEQNHNEQIALCGSLTLLSHEPFF